MFILRSRNVFTGVLTHSATTNTYLAREGVADAAASMPDSEHAVYTHPGTTEDAQDCISTHGDVALCVDAVRLF